MEKIFLGLEDEVTDVVEKMRNSDDSELVLVVPKGATLLQSAVNVRLLKKKSDDLEKKLGVVASDPISKQLASQAGLVVHHSINSISEAVPARVKKETNHDEVSSEEESVSTHDGGHINVKHYNASATEALKHLKKERPKNSAFEQNNPIDEAEEPNGHTVSVSEDEAPMSSEIENAESVIENSSDGAEASLVMGKEFHSEPPVTHINKKIKLPNKPLRIPRWIPVLIGIIILLLLAGSGTVLAVVPKATVTVSVPAEKLSKKVDAILDMSLESSNAQKIAGITHEQTIEQTGSANATGKKQVGDKAKGVVTVSNSWSSDNITIAKDVVLTSTDKKLQFRVNAVTSIPGVTISKKNGQLVETPGKADVSVVADQPGDQYNLGPTTFSIAGYTSDVSGASSKTFSGGTNRELTIVTDKDIENAKVDASSKMQNSAKELLVSQISADEVLIDQKVSDVTYSDPDHKNGEEAASVSIKATGKAVVYTAKNADIEAYLTSVFREGLSESKSAVLPSVNIIRWSVKEGKNNTLNLSSEVEAQIIAKFDSGALKKQLRMKKSNYVIEKLTRDLEAKSVEVSINPAGWVYMPILTRNIELNVKE